ncbi:MAG: peptidase, partial [Phenylobacterium sp.]|nr:peptidase [Phenylobacterium sp.]
MKTLWLAAAAAAALSAPLSAALCGQAAAATKAKPAPRSATKPAAGPSLTAARRLGAWGFDLSGRDTAVSPGDDLFRYADGSYVKSLQIPPDRSRYGAFDTLVELSQNRMRAVLEKASADKAATGERAKVGTMYRSFMDQARVDALGATPLAADLAAVRAATTKTELARLMGQAHRGFGGAVFNADVSEDAKDPTHYAVYLGQAGLVLPDRDYYLQDSFAPQKAKYEEYVAQMLGLAGWPNPEANAKAIVAMETEIARASWPRAERR